VWPLGSEERRPRQKSRDVDQSRKSAHRQVHPGNGELRWQRRELEKGWRHPQYEGFYDDSSTRARAAFSENPSGPHSVRSSGRHASSSSPLESWDIWGPESGKGPKGYRRSDARLLEEVCERLTRHGQLDARGIKVSCEKGEVVLRGSVKDGEAKRLAEACAKSVIGVQSVRNKLKLRSDRS
jgi:osmotically-inducible protein OsmY